MKKIQEQLQSVSKNLASLAKQVDKLSKQLKKAEAKPAVKAARGPGKKKAPAKKAVAKAATAPADKSASLINMVYDCVRRSRNGITIAKLKEKTGLGARQVSNALYKLSKKGMVAAKSRGIYVKK